MCNAIHRRTKYVDVKLYVHMSWGPHAMLETGTITPKKLALPCTAALFVVNSSRPKVSKSTKPAAKNNESYRKSESNMGSSLKKTGERVSLQLPDSI